MQEAGGDVVNGAVASRGGDDSEPVERGLRRQFGGMAGVARRPKLGAVAPCLADRQKPSFRATLPRGWIVNHAQIAHG